MTSANTSRFAQIVAQSPQKQENSFVMKSNGNTVEQQNAYLSIRWFLHCYLEFPDHFVTANIIRYR